MPNPVGDISKIHLPSGDEYNIKDTVSGYSKVFKINVTSSSNTYSADKTYSEIVYAYESSEYDIIIVSEINDSAAEPGEYIAPLQVYDPTNNILTFICVCDESRLGSVASGNKNIIRKYQIEDDETVTVSESILPPFMTILSYGHNTWQDFLDAYNNNSIVYCRASSNSNPGSGAQTRMAFMAYVNASPPTEVEFQYYRSRNGHTDNYQGDQVYVYKVNSSGTWSVTVRNAYTKMIAGTGLTGTYANATVDSVASQGTLTFKTKLKSETALTNGATAATEVANRVYPVAVDKDGYLAVNVPWTDTTGVTDVTVDSTSVVSSGVANLVTSTSHPYDPSTNPLATVDDISSAGGGNVTDVQIDGVSALDSSGVADLITSTSHPYSPSNPLATVGDVATASGYVSSHTLFLHLAEPQPEPQPTLRLIYETTLTNWESDGDGAYVAYASNQPTESFPTVITVDYDGTIYRDIPCRIEADYWEYGAVWDISNYTWDFSDYPFVIMYENIPEYGISFSAHASTNTTHTFKVYAESQPTYEKIYELTFSDWQDDGDGSYFTDIYGSGAPSEMFPNTVTVDWDGVRYKDLEIVGGYQWGAPYDYQQSAYDFSVYPFSFQLYDVGGLELHLVANSDAEHTFEVYVEVDD